MLVLGIETSCDETAASVVAEGQTILSNVVSTSLAEHSPFGGVVPEIACRRHVEWIQKTVSEAITQAKVSQSQIDAIAVTQGPGLPGALLVGISMAKAMAWALEKPLLGIHHLQAHLYANFLSSTKTKGQTKGSSLDPSTQATGSARGFAQDVAPRTKEKVPRALPVGLHIEQEIDNCGNDVGCKNLTPRFPYMGFIVSGGHTILVLVRDVDDYKVIGQTIDDAAGEAFDKVARLLGFGYPGGPIIDAQAKEGNPDAIAFPRGMIHEKNFDFSFSGVKTAVMYYVQNKIRSTVNGQRSKERLNHRIFLSPFTFDLPPSLMNDICASFQEAVVDVMVKKSLRACEEYEIKTLVVGGGVAANSRLREVLSAQGGQRGIKVLFPPKGLSIDNAAMIAGLGGALFKKGYRWGLAITAKPNWPIDSGTE